MGPPGGALAGLVGDYGSDSEGEESPVLPPVVPTFAQQPMWSMCVDPTSGFPYYWEQVTNTVSWEPPPGLLTLPTAPSTAGAVRGVPAPQVVRGAPRAGAIPPFAAAVSIAQQPKPDTDTSSDEEEEKIELITSYYNSDSGTEDEEARERSVIRVYPANAKTRAKKSSKSAKDNSDVATSKKTKRPKPALTYGPDLPNGLAPPGVTKDDAPSKIYGPQLPKNSELPVFGPTLPNNTEVPSVTEPRSPIEKLAGESTVVSTSQMEDMTVKETASTMNSEKAPSPLNAAEENENNVADSTDSQENAKKLSEAITNENSNENKSLDLIETDNLDELIEVKSKLLKKLGDLVPSEIKYLVGSPKSASRTDSGCQTPVKSPETPPGSPPAPPKSTTALDMDVDDLIAQIEKEQPIDQPSLTSDASETMCSIESVSNKSAITSEEISENKADLPFKPLFPSVNNVEDTNAPIFPLVDVSSNLSQVASELKEDVNMCEITVTNDIENTVEVSVPKSIEIKTVNKYDSTLVDDGIESSAFKRKRRIALDVLPAKKANIAEEPPNTSVKSDYSYTTKYAENFEVCGERMGLGFKPNLNERELNSGTNNYYSNFKRGSIAFKKGETLAPVAVVNEDDNVKINEDKDPQMEKQKNLVESKLKFLTHSLPSVPPLQQLYIELQTLWSARKSIDIASHIAGWLGAAATELGQLEARAAPQDWACSFSSEMGCYVYENLQSGERRWEYPTTPTASAASTVTAAPLPTPAPATAHDDMDICTTPPPPPPPPPRDPPPLPPLPPVIGPSLQPLPPGTVSPPPSLASTNSEICEPSPPPPSPPPPPSISGQDLLMAAELQLVTPQSGRSDSSATKLGEDSLCAALDSFYSDLASLDTVVPPPAPAPAETPAGALSPTPRPPPPVSSVEPAYTVATQADKKDKKKEKKSKTKNIGLKHKSVSTLVAKWKKVQESLDT